MASNYQPVALQDAEDGTNDTKAKETAPDVEKGLEIESAVTELEKGPPTYQQHKDKEEEGTAAETSDQNNSNDGASCDCTSITCDCLGDCGDCFEENSKMILMGGGCLCAIGILLLIILIPMSIQKVEQDEYGIRYNDFTNTVYDDVYTEGKYVLTPQTIMFKFNNLVQKMELDVYCLTLNGVEVQLNVDVQYQLPQNQAFNAWKDFGGEDTAEQYLLLVLSDSLRDVCGRYEAKDYYEGRLGFQTELEDALIADVRYANAYYNITAAILAAYDFPDSLEATVQEKREAQNDITIAENERAGALTEADTVLLSARIEAEKIAIDAQAEEDSILAEASAQAEAIKSIWENRLSVYADIMQAMNISVDRFVYQYLRNVVLLNADGPITSFDY